VNRFPTLKIHGNEANTYNLMLSEYRLPVYNKMERPTNKNSKWVNPTMSENKPQSDELVGKQISQYTVLEEIGRGGMATVYKARQASMNRTVAIKVLPRHFMHDPDFLERFQREVDVIASLEHPHILPIYDYGETDGIPFIAMRYLGGGSMADLIRRGKPKIPDLEKPFAQLAQALDYAHQQGIIHRDLKPGNIMLDENGNAYLSDFGIARVVGSKLTGSDMIIGTPAYMSPEQANGVSIDARSDIYALGIVLFELITGREPYQAETPMAVLLKHMSEPLPSIRDVRSDVPETIEAVINMATEKNPDDRYASAGEMAQAFSEALAGRSTAETKRSIDNRTRQAKHYTEASTITNVADTDTIIEARTPPTMPDQATIAAATQPPQKQPNRAPLYAAIAVIVLLILGGGGFGLFYNQQVEQVTADATAQAIAAIPTPFRDAIQIEQPEYRISMLDDFMPQAEDFRDESDATRLRHVWGDPEDRNRIELEIHDNFQGNLVDYEREIGGKRDWELIEESVQGTEYEDGTKRRSYRVDGTGRFPAGQVDVFFIPRGTKLAIISIYLSDEVGGTQGQINLMQLILDSFQLKM
jgi:serine/threonine protein kinase